jgi:hypothetical protein
VTSCQKDYPIEIREGFSTLADGRKVNSLCFETKKDLKDFYKKLEKEFKKEKKIVIPSSIESANEFIIVNKDWYKDTIYLIIDELNCKNLDNVTFISVFLSFYDKNSNDILNPKDEKYLRIKKYFNNVYIETAKDIQIENNKKTSASETTKKTKTTTKDVNSKYYTTKDTILITNEIGETLEFSKQEFNNLIDNHPEFFNAYKEYGYPQDPDQAYHCNTSSIEFSSEVGQDNYYILYAYFLKQKNGVKEYAKQREKLIDIYSNINSLFGHFEYGGTYFGHQRKRILGYAEYSIYLLPKNKDDISKTYDITKQKELYIKSLRQLIDDESKIDNETLGKEKIERTKELNKIIDDLDKLITDNFYLRRAQEFHYEHYEYY